MTKSIRSYTMMAWEIIPSASLLDRYFYQNSSIVALILVLNRSADKQILIQTDTKVKQKYPKRYFYIIGIGETLR